MTWRDLQWCSDQGQQDGGVRKVRRRVVVTLERVLANRGSAWLVGSTDLRFDRPVASIIILKRFEWVETTLV